MEPTGAPKIAPRVPPTSGSTLVRPRGGVRRWFLAFVLSRWNPRYDRLLSDRKRALLGRLTGNVLELGPGTGANLAYYPADVRWTGVEPNPYMHAHLLKTARQLDLAVQLKAGCASSLEAADESLDAVVSTLVLCSVPDVPTVLREVLRVLKPGGQFVFVEHVAAPRGTALRRLQRLGRPISRFLGDGCHLDRETWVWLEHAGFGHLECEHFQVPIPLNGPHIAGRGIKAGPT